MGLARQGCLVGFDFERQAQRGSRVTQHAGIADYDKISVEIRLRQHHAGIRPNAGRLARSNDNPRLVHLDFDFNERIVPQAP
jgi:hypothetical protein